MNTQSKSGEQALLQTLDRFMESKVLMTCFQLGIFELLAQGALSRQEILERAGLPPRTGTILLDAACALNLLTVEGQRLGIPEEMKPHVVRDPSRFQMVPYLAEYYSAVYRDLVDMAELVRTNGASSQFKLRDYFHDDVSQVDEGVASDYSDYMDRTMKQIAEVVLETYSFSAHRSLVDLCGGPGTFSSAVLERHPHMSGAFIDVPAVVKVGMARLESAPPDLKRRLTPMGGDVFKEPLPAGVDVVSMCRSAHDWDEDRVVALFRKVHEALPRGGRLLIIERMVPDEFDPDARALYMRAVYFLCKSTTACYRSAKKYTELLRSVGFEKTDVVVPERAPYAFFRGMKILVAEK
jgi:demethylspheroidene O-methyltransferase